MSEAREYNRRSISILSYCLVLKTQWVEPHLGPGHVTKTPETVRFWAHHIFSGFLYPLREGNVKGLHEGDSKALWSALRFYR